MSLSGKNGCKNHRVFERANESSLVLRKIYEVVRVNDFVQ